MRGHNEGSIHKRKDGYWAAVIDLGVVNGKRKRKYFYGETRKEVAEKLKIALRDQQQGLPVDVKRQTVEQFLEQWLEESVKPTVRERTYESYTQLVHSHIIPALGHIQLQQLTAQQIDTFMNQKRQAG